MLQFHFDFIENAFDRSQLDLVREKCCDYDLIMRLIVNVYWKS